MQKRKIISIIAVLTMMLLLCVHSGAQNAYMIGSDILSPGLLSLAQNCTMVKGGLINTQVGFSDTDFSDALGYTPSSITITSLPTADEGVLYFGSLPASLNLQVSSRNLSLLRFVPKLGCTDASFRFRGDSVYSHACSIRFTEKVNLAPVSHTTDAITVWTQQDIMTCGILPGYDPEGDPVQFEIISYPLKGLLEVNNPANGTYQYTPYDGATGTDVFSYRIQDYYGNYSSVRTMEVTVDKAACDIVFADMTNHWAHNAAVVMVADDAMEVFAEGGTIYFRPEQLMTREDFLVTVMQALGAGEVAPCNTVFKDEEKIKPENTGYIARAYSLGIIQGSAEQDGLYFKPTDTITRAEAAVILCTILGAETPEIIPTFADNSAIPTWAKPSLYALHGLGILQGNGDGYISPDSTINRAQTAQMLLSIKKLLGEV